MIHLLLLTYFLNLSMPEIPKYATVSLIILSFFSSIKSVKPFLMLFYYHKLYEFCIFILNFLYLLLDQQDLHSLLSICLIDYLNIIVLKRTHYLRLKFVCHSSLHYNIFIRWSSHLTYILEKLKI